MAVGVSGVDAVGFNDQFRSMMRLSGVYDYKMPVGRGFESTRIGPVARIGRSGCVHSLADSRFVSTIF